MTDLRTQLSTQRPIHRSELYSYLISETDGAALSQKDIVHLTGLLPRDIKRYSCAEPDAVEDNLARALLARSINTFPVLYAYLRYPSLQQLYDALHSFYPQIIWSDVAVLIGASKQNSKRWREHEQPQSPVFLRNMRALMMIIGSHGEQGAAFWLASYHREVMLLGKQNELSDYLTAIASAILASEEFVDFEKRQFLVT